MRSRNIIGPDHFGKTPDSIRPALSPVAPAAGDMHAKALPDDRLQNCLASSGAPSVAATLRLGVSRTTTAVAYQPISSQRRLSESRSLGFPDCCTSAQSRCSTLTAGLLLSKAFERSSSIGWRPGAGVVGTRFARFVKPCTADTPGRRAVP